MQITFNRFAANLLMIALCGLAIVIMALMLNAPYLQNAAVADALNFAGAGYLPAILGN